MQALMLRARALACLIATAGALSACGGGGNSTPPPPPAPTAIPENLAISAPATAESAATVAFGNSASALTGLKFQWDFGDGSTSTDAAPSHGFASGGEFEVVLKVTNEAGSTRETRTRLSITNIANVRGLECTGTSSTGWCWQNPRPTGNRVNTVYFLTATTGWRGGENGEIFKTTDGGSTWARQNSGITASIYGIRFLNATTGWATGAFGAVLRTTDGGATWNVAKVGDASYYGPADPGPIQPVDAKTVYIGRTGANTGGGYGPLYASKDGGVTWQMSNVTPNLITSTGKFWSQQNNAITVSKDGGQSYDTVLSLKAPSGYNYLDTTNLWPLDDLRAVAYSRASAFDYATYTWTYAESVFTTVDGGVTWSRADSTRSGYGTYLQRVLSLSADGKVLLGSVGGALVRSTDGGKTWAANLAPVRDDTIGAYTVLAGGDLIASSYNGTGLWLSKDDGLTWTRLASPAGSDPYPPSFNAESIRRVEAGVLTASSGQGGVYLSRDDGQSWTRLLAPPDNSYSLPSIVAFSDARNGLMSDAAGRLFSTKDGGLTWDPRFLALGAPRSLQFVNKQTGWLVSNDGKLYKSSDAGKTWALAPTAPGLIFGSINFVNDTLGWSQRYGGGAQFAYTRDGGKSWTELALPNGVQAMRQGEQAWLAVGGNGAVFVSTDAGLTWNAVYTGTAAHLQAVAFSDAKTAWAVGTDSTLLRSDDAGARWTVVKLPGGNALLRDIRFANAKVGWIVGDGGAVFNTQDGGKTWRMQPSGTSNALTSIQALDANTAWITGTYGTVLATGTGGN